MEDDSSNSNHDIVIEVGDDVRLEGANEDDFFVGKVVCKDEETLGVHWYYRKQDILDDLDDDAFVGDYTQEEIYDLMTESDLVSSDHFDGNNPIGSVVEKMQIGKGKEWNCRFKMTMLTDEIEVEMLGQHQQNKKKRSAAAQKNGTPVKKKKKQRNDAPSLWEIYDLNPQDVAPKVAKCGFSKRTFLAEEVAHFFLFVHERQEIWEGRNRGDAAPWSKSKAMTDYFFCNNYRELDRGTNYFRHQMMNLKDQYPNISHKDWLSKVLWSSLCYRLMNKIETFQSFGGIPEVHQNKEYLAFLTKAMDRGVKLFTGAHLNMGLDRYKSTMQEVVRNLTKQLVDPIVTAHDELDASGHDALQECYRTINSICNVGPFFAWQVTCDLLECRCLPNCHEDDFAKLGKGAVKGLGIMANTAVTNKNELELIQQLQKQQDEVFCNCLGVRFPRFAGRALSLKNIEHALCEFSKYTAMQKTLSKGEKVCGQRTNKSRQSLDREKVCLGCGASDRKLCHTCREAYCNECEPGDGSQYFCCNRCQNFETMEFAD